MYVDETSLRKRPSFEDPPELPQDYFLSYIYQATVRLPSDDYP